MSDKIEALRVLVERPLRLSAFIAATNHLNFDEVLATANEQLVIVAFPVGGPEAVVMLAPAGQEALSKEGTTHGSTAALDD